MPNSDKANGNANGARSLIDLTGIEDDTDVASPSKSGADQKPDLSAWGARPYRVDGQTPKDAASASRQALQGWHARKSPDKANRSSASNFPDASIKTEKPKQRTPGHAKQPRFPLRPSDVATPKIVVDLTNGVDAQGAQRKGNVVSRPSNGNAQLSNGSATPSPLVPALSVRWQATSQKPGAQYASQTLAISAPKVNGHAVAQQLAPKPAPKPAQHFNVLAEQASDTGTKTSSASKQHFGLKRVEEVVGPAASLPKDTSSGARHLVQPYDFRSFLAPAPAKSGSTASSSNSASAASTRRPAAAGLQAKRTADGQVKPSPTAPTSINTSAPSTTRSAASGHQANRTVNELVGSNFNLARAAAQGAASNGTPTVIAPSVTNATDVVQVQSNGHSRRFYVPVVWDPNLPAEVQAVLSALGRELKSNGKPNRKIVKQWVEENIGVNKYFSGHGDLTTTCPLWDYTLQQLGLTIDGWRHLNRKSKDDHVDLPGPGQDRKRPGRPPRESNGASRDYLPNADTGSHQNDPPIPTAPSLTLVKEHSHVQNGNIPSPKDPDPAATLDHTVVKPADSNVASVTARPSNGATPVQPSDPTPSLVRMATLPGSSVPRIKALIEAMRMKLNNRDVRGLPWEPEEDELLICLKEELQLAWPQIGLYFAHRHANWQGCQVHYSSKLSRRNQLPATATTSPKAAQKQRSPVAFREQSREQSTDFAGQPVARKSTRLERNNASARNYQPRKIFEQMWREVGLKDEEDTAQQNPTALEDEDGGDRGLVGVQRSRNSPDRRSWRVPTTEAPRGVPKTATSRDTFEKQRYRAAVGAGLMKVKRRSIARPAKSRLPETKPKLYKRRSISIDRPYLTWTERRTLTDSQRSDAWDDRDLSRWHGSVLHVDFSPVEITTLEECVFDVFDKTPDDVETTDVAPRSMIANLLKQQCRADKSAEAVHPCVRKASWHALNTGGILNRTRDSIESFLLDVLDEHKQKSHRTWVLEDGIAKFRNLTRLEAASRQTSVHRGLRHREIGSRPAKQRCEATSIKDAVYDTYGPSLSFTGTSSDVNAVAWAPNGTVFAVGSAALTDSHSMQYNRSNNLLIGDVDAKTLRELPHHATPRPITDEGANASRAMFVSQDPILFQSVSAVGFSADGTAMYSAGYDHSMRVYDLRCGLEKAPVSCVFRHTAPIDLLAVSNHGLVATGCQTTKGSVRVFRHDLDAEDKKSLKVTKMSSPRALENPAQHITPTSLEWGHSVFSQARYLLCGFSAHHEDYGEGEVCAWDIEAGTPLVHAQGSRNIFDVAWSPSTYGRFAVARTPVAANVNRGTHSVVDIFDARRMGQNMQINSQKTLELECPARDMNDIVFNAADDFFMSVGCTDGSTYVWDLRRPDELLHRFTHGKPLIELREDEARECYDTGVRFLSWDATRRHLITGSSDGLIAKWDPYRASEDAHVKNIAQLKSGVMSGTFNDDFSSLLLGEVNGTINVMNVGRNAEEDDFENFQLQKASNDEMTSIYGNLGIERPTIADKSGVAAARELVESGAINIVPLGDLPIRQVVQGPAYDGPFDRSAAADDLRAMAEARPMSFQPSADACKIGHEIPRLKEEEKGDSGEWKYRIPETFQYLPQADKKQHIDKHVSCLRCGKSLIQHANIYEAGHAYNVDALHCEACEPQWRVDCLGYTPLDEDLEVHEEPLHLYRSKTAPDALDDGAEDLGEAWEVGDQVADYMHSFWHDRPASPL